MFFVGAGTIILRGVTIEDNVIIGAGSVVTKDCKEGYMQVIHVHLFVLIRNM